MSQDHVATERRFEVRAMNVFQFFVLSVGMVAVWNFEWWLLGICLVSILLTGLIGQDLAKNKDKTLAQLRQGSEGKPGDALYLYHDYFLARSSAHFTYLAALTVGAMALELKLYWWIVVGAIAAAPLIVSFIGHKRARERLKLEGERERQPAEATRERARRQEEEASASPLVDVVVHGYLAFKRRRSYQNNVTAALGVIIVGGLAIVILRSPVDPSVTLSRSNPSVGRDEAHIWVRPPGPNGVSVVFVTGVIQPGDDETFANVTRTLHGVTKIVLESLGGDLITGIRIGRRIKQNGWLTQVAPNTTCASVCGLMWLAGMRRFADADSRIGFHAAYFAETGQPTSGGNAVVGAYLRELGFQDRTIYFLTQKPPNGDLEWLTVEKARDYDIRID